MGAVCILSFQWLTGRYPRNIEKHLKGFKAEELGTFLIRYLLPLTFQRVSDTTFRALQRLVLVISKATFIEIAYDEIDLIDEQMTMFLDWFYSTFYKGNVEYLRACKYTVHGLHHLAQNIRDWGPASYYWQFTEVMCHCLPAHRRSVCAVFSRGVSKVECGGLQIYRFSCINISSSLSQQNSVSSISLGCLRHLSLQALPIPLKSDTKTCFFSHMSRKKTAT